MKDNKLFLPIDLVQPGMCTAEVVFNKHGNVMIWENVVLDQNTIQRLKNIGIDSIAVHSETQLDKVNYTELDPSQQFNLKYEEDVNTTKQIFQDISSGKNLSMEVADQVVNSVLVNSDKNSAIISSITQVRSIDEYTYYHSLNVSMLSALVGKWLRLKEKNIRDLALAGLLHDIGKTKIPLEILNKPGRLTESEFSIMKKHSEYSYEIVSSLNVNPDILTAILTHHEKEDGSGYPLGLTGDKINLYAKIIGIVDIFDAMTANRTYKSKDTPFDVFRLMQHGSFGLLDPVVLNVFLENIGNYYIGSKVTLNTGETGEVVFMNNLNLSRPVVRVNDRYIDTSVSKFVRIKEFI